MKGEEEEAYPCVALVDEAFLGTKGPHSGDAGNGLGEVAVDGGAAREREGGTADGAGQKECEQRPSAPST